MGDTPRSIQNLCCVCAAISKMRYALLVLVLSLAGASAKLKLIGEHHAGDTDHGDRGALYRFGIDNYDETGHVASRQEGVVVHFRLPIDAVIDEKYFYLEGSSSEDGFSECHVQQDGPEENLIICDVKRVI